VSWSVLVSLEQATGARGGVLVFSACDDSSVLFQM